MRFESRGKDLQSISPAEENQGKEMAVVVAEVGKMMRNRKETFSRLVEKWCKLSVPSEYWLM